MVKLENHPITLLEGSMEMFLKVSAQLPRMLAFAVTSLLFRREKDSHFLGKVTSWQNDADVGSGMVVAVMMMMVTIT